MERHANNRIGFGYFGGLNTFSDHDEEVVAVVNEVRLWLAREQANGTVTMSRWLVAWGDFSTRIRAALQAESGAFFGGKEDRRHE